MGIRQDVYVGTYSLPIKFGTGQILHGKGKGVYLYGFDTDTAELTLINITEGVDNPSFLAVSGNAERLYAVNELKEYDGKPTGAVSAFRIEADGSLKMINRMAAGGTDPCHLVISPDGRRLIVSNYMSGSVSVFLVLEGGALGGIEQFIQYEGKSVNIKRQSGPHAHSAVFSKDARFIYICDLGTDRVRAYRYGGGGLPLSSEGMAEYTASAGAGPRHAEFGADGRYCYIINELESTVVVTAVDREKGTLTEVQKVSAVPEGEYCGSNSCADLHITPDGRFLYSSNRGLDSITIYRIDRDSGLLSLVGFEPCGGRTPRSFTLDETGGFLLCANQDSDCIAVFSIDKETGQLTKRSETYAPTPVCVKMSIKRRY